MKIGIAVTANNRPLHLAHWVEQMRLFKPEGVDVVLDGWVIADDSKNNPKLGIAKQKNDCLRLLKKHDPDYYFLFDDDTFVVKKGWAEYFIEAARQSEMDHFQLQVPSNATKVTQVAQDDELENPIQIQFFDNSNGCFMFFTKRCIEKVGGFNEAFGTYGYEHADISQRIHRAGLTKFGAYCTPKDARKYIYSLDLEPESELHRKLKHKGSMPSKEALAHIQKSAKVFQQPSPIYIPL